MTGKTDYLRRQIERAAEKYGPDRILVTSFTRAAAAEIAGRGLAIPESNVGTLHAICYRALRSPVLAHDHLNIWNRKYPELAMTAAINLEESGPLDVEPRRGAARPGDQRRARMDVLRARLVPVDQWPPDIREFHERWEDWKRTHSFHDFTDLLERALRELKIGPGDPTVLFADEAQDFSRLQTQLIRQWGQHAEWFVLAGDPEQCIFTFSGASPAGLRVPLDASRVHILRTSYRIPRAVYLLAEYWLWHWMHPYGDWQAQHDAVRHAELYSPRDAAGVVGRIPRAHWRDPGAVIDAAERWARAGKTVMILSACGYMLTPTLTELRKRGVPFWNPYARKNATWNPLGKATGGQRRKYGKNAAAGRIAALLAPATEDPWKPGHIQSWSQWLRDDALAPGARAEIAALRANARGGVMRDEILAWFPDAQPLLSALDMAVNDADNEVSRQGVRDMLAWWLNRLQDKYRARAAYAARVARRYGALALVEDPRIIVGTGHSVKGGAADVVVIYPDLSRAGAQAWALHNLRPPVIRLAYVMITRAREQVWVCAPRTPRHLPLTAALGAVGSTVSLAHAEDAALPARVAAPTLPPRLASLYAAQDARLEQAGLRP